jgi:hypothetical protein
MFEDGSLNKKSNSKRLVDAHKSNIQRIKEGSEGRELSKQKR